MPHRDSLDKIVLSYLAPVTSHPLAWRGQVIAPMPLHFGPSLLRGFTCPANCGGCCPTFSLDYLPEEKEPHPYPLTRRVVEFCGRSVEVWTDMQAENKSPRCRHLVRENGRCGIHGKQPFSCDFELIRFHRHADHWTASEQLFGRGWNMKRVDGGVGALCTVPDATTDSALDVARRLRRLVTWADHFGLKAHRVRRMVDYCETFAERPRRAPKVVIQ